MSDEMKLAMSVRVASVDGLRTCSDFASKLSGREPYAIKGRLHFCFGVKGMIRRLLALLIARVYIFATNMILIAKTCKNLF